MHLSPTEEDRMRVFAVAELARRTLERGSKLNAPEAVALVCDEMHMAARAGATYEMVAAAGRGALSRDRLMDGVSDLVPQIRVEVPLDEGTRLIVLRDPFGERTGGLLHPASSVAINEGRRTIALEVRNTSARPVRVSSHYPFWRTNPRLAFDRDAAEGFRLNLPAGASILWAPGETREVELVALRERG
jgi:urease subunit gamma/beta